MRRRSKAGDKRVKSRRKSATLKHRNAPNATRNRGASIAGQGTVVARLTHERDEALLRETANSEILRLISRSPGDLELVFRSILGNATRICNANFGTLFRFDGENFQPVAQFNTPTALLEAQTRRGPFQPQPGSQLDRVMRTKRVSHSADMAAEPVLVWSTKLGGARSQVTVPMLKGDTLIGAIVIYRQEVRPFTGKQIELVKNFAAQAVIAIENARLLSELRQRTTDLAESLEQQTAASRVLSIISSSPTELEPVFQAILANATRLCDAKFAGLSLYDGEVLRYVAHYKIPPEYTDMRLRERLWRPHPRSSMAEVIRTKQPVQVDDLRTSPAYLEGDSTVRAIVHLGGARTIILVPMLKDDKLIGVIAIYRQEVRPFTDKQIALVQNFAAQAVIAIENARLLNELRQRTADLSESLEQQTATAEVLRVISSSPGELELVFEAMLTNATRLCEAKFGVLYLHDKGRLRFGAAHDVPPEFVEARGKEPFTPAPDASTGKVVATKQAVQIADLAATQSYSDRNPVVVAAVEGGGVRTALSVPMLKENALIGVITIFRKEVRSFTDKQTALLQNFAAQAVIAIENTQLLNELRDSLDRQTAAADVLGVISKSPGDLEPVFHAILENATRICDAKFGSLHLAEGDHFRRAAHYNPPPAYLELLLREPFYRAGPQTALGRVAATKQLVHIPDIAAEQLYAERDPLRVAGVELLGVRTLLVVPMLKGTELVGMIAIYRQEVRPFTDKQIELLQNFAAQAVIAIENARLLNELRQRTDELSRRTDDLSEALEQQTATSEVLKVISKSPGDLQPVFEAILANATRICEAKLGNLFLREANGYRNVALHGPPSRYAEWYQQEPVIDLRQHPRAPLAYLDRTREVLHITDLATDPAYDRHDPRVAALVESAGARTLVIVPMFKEDELIGGIAIYRTEVRPFTDKQIALMQNFAAQAVIAIENTRLLNELRQQTEEVSKLNQQLEERVADQVGEIERMSRLRRFLPPQVADLIVASGTEKQLESHRREITALFCDLRGFTGFSESADPEDVMALLRDYHAAIGEIVVKYSGTLERFAGDGVMVIFNDPVPVENPALQAVLMALDMRTAIGAMIEKWRLLGHDLGFGIGIAHGFATLGTIGFEGRFDYAAIGTVSNVASRLCDEAKPGQILISPRVMLAVDKTVTVGLVGEFNLKGIRRPMAAYNVLALSISKPN